MHRMRRPRTRGLIVVVAAVLGLAACNGPAQPSPELEARLVGTDTTAPNGVAALIDSSTDDDALRDGQFCGGALVSDRVVVTANHCVDGKDPDSVDVVLGIDDLCTGTSTAATRYPVAEIITGPEGSDSAALVLTAPTTATPFGIPTEVPAFPFEATSYGWGDINAFLDGPCTVKEISLTYEELSSCDRAAEWDDAIDPAYDLCAKPTRGTQLNTCSGDSGGPSVIMGESGLEVVGLTDWGASCSKRAYGGYISVPSLDSWLGPILASTGG